MIERRGNSELYSFCYNPLSLYEQTDPNDLTSLQNLLELKNQLNQIQRHFSADFSTLLLRQPRINRLRRKPVPDQSPNDNWAMASQLSSRHITGNNGAENSGKSFIENKMYSSTQSNGYCDENLRSNVPLSPWRLHRSLLPRPEIRTRSSSIISSPGSVNRSLYANHSASTLSSYSHGSVCSSNDQNSLQSPLSAYNDQIDVFSPNISNWPFHPENRDNVAITTSENKSFITVDNFKFISKATPLSHRM